MRRFLLLTALAALAASGCATRAGNRPAPAPVAPTPAATTIAPVAPVAAPQATPTSDFRVTYGWAVPSSTVTVTNPLSVPVAPPPAIPLPYLVEIRTGDHDGFSRITFAFRGGFPEYRFGYVARVLADGSDAPVPLSGNGALRLVFVSAQAHDNAGRSTVVDAANRSIGFPHLRAYAPAGDYEGYLTFGLGLQVAPNSDQVLPIRTGQTRRPDGLYVVAIDVKDG